MSDRIISTCAVRSIPPAWIRQLADGGVIVAPMHGNGQGLMVLRKTATDEVTGRFDPELAGFMPLHASVDDPLALDRWLGFAPGPIPYHDSTTLGPTTLLGASLDLLLWLDLHLPDVNIGHAPTRQRVIVTAAGSYAEAGLDTVENRRWPVLQGGPCRLWDTLEHAMQQWQRLDHPGRNRRVITARTTN